MLILTAMAAVCALVEGLLVPMPDSLVELDDYAVNLEQAEQLLPVIWVDGRAETDFLAGHLDGALHLNLDNWDNGLGNFLLNWDPDFPVIVYCDGNGCESSRAISERLREELGVENIYWLIDGWVALQKGGFLP